MALLYDAHRGTSAPTPPAFAIVLAGGTGRRMGGASKPDVVVAGRRMIDHVLGELAAQSVPAVVVGPPDLDVPVGAPTGVILVREDPPLGGPAAGIAAGYAAGLSAFAAGVSSETGPGSGSGAPAGVSPEPGSGTTASCVAGPSPSGSLVAILACDAPFAPRVLPDLVAAASDSGPHICGGDSSAESVGAVAITPDGRLQRLLCVVDSGALGAAIRRLDADGGVRDRSVRALLGDLPLTPVDVPAWATDADTPDEVFALERMSPDGRESSR